ncbi:unnamed protein product [Spirodela intermedia]|uniref:Uncharacterized protein n=1 Tax=Spirodela intermedia TaxID=51605 RepID=A0A7I8JNV1_SPIIN|nr:unnamed protein product [Spirodela intermedia]CAA6671829.1 unnamed protein product [Spirodela intermedia]
MVAGEAVAGGPRRTPCRAGERRGGSGDFLARPLRPAAQAQADRRQPGGAAGHWARGFPHLRRGGRHQEQLLGEEAAAPVVAELQCWWRGGGFFHHGHARRRDHGGFRVQRASPPVSPPSPLQPLSTKAEDRASEAWPLLAATCRDRGRKGEIFPGLRAFSPLEAPINEFSKGFPGSIYRDEGIPQIFPRTEFLEEEAHQASPRSKRETLENHKFRDLGVSVGEDEPEKKLLEVGRRRWLLILTRLLILVVFLTIGSKKIALGISISAMAALFNLGGSRKSLRSATGGISIPGVPAPLLDVPPGSSGGEEVAAESPAAYEPDLGSEWSWEARAPLEVLFSPRRWRLQRRRKTVLKRKVGRVWGGYTAGRVGRRRNC